jgi:hypothetical protein
MSTCSLALQTIPVEAPAAEAYIDPAGPTMPRITLGATLDPGFSVVSLKYEVTISYRDHGRDDLSPMFSGSGPNNVAMDFQNQVLGGTLSGRADVLIRRPNGSTYWNGWQAIPSRPIYGKNPEIAALVAQAGLLPPIVIAKLRSDLQMFGADHLPFHRAGFGLFQLTDPAPGEIWHWRTHVAVGVADHARRSAAAAAYPESLRQSDPSTYRRLPDYDDAELQLETYQSYDTGRYWQPRRSGLFGRNWRWVKTTSDTLFADRCLANERDLASAA